MCPGSRTQDTAQCPVLHMRYSSASAHATFACSQEAIGSTFVHSQNPCPLPTIATHTHKGGSRVRIAVDGLASQLCIALLPCLLTHDFYIVGTRVGAGALLLAAACDAILLCPGYLAARKAASRAFSAALVASLFRPLPTGATTSSAAATTTAPTTNCPSTAPAADRRWRWRLGRMLLAGAPSTEIRECQCDDFYRQIVLDYEKSDFYHFIQKITS